MSLIQIADARARKQARALRAKRKEIEAKRAALPVVKLFRAIGITQEPGKVLLQMYDDNPDGKVLLAVAKLDSIGIEDLCNNLKSAAGVLEKGVIWTP